MRPRPSHDSAIAREVFAQKQYALAARDPMIKTVVDLGANVGYSVLYFLREHPQAHVMAFEPHPEHLRLLREHLALNQVDAGRVRVHPVAVSNAAGSFHLTDAGAGSTVVGSPGERSIPIQVVDLFPLLEGLSIDLLKMDIEGAEFALLNDPRFARIKARWLTLEYHHQEGLADAQECCLRRLEELEYRLVSHETCGVGGVVWAQYAGKT